MKKGVGMALAEKGMKQGIEKKSDMMFSQLHAQWFYVTIQYQEVCGLIEGHAYSIFCVWLSTIALRLGWVSSSFSSIADDYLPRFVILDTRL